MVRNFFMTLLMLVSMVAVVGCGNDDGSDSSVVNPGAIDMALELADGSQIGTIHYVISGNGITPIQGDINVSGSQSTISAFVDSIPQGGGYLLTLTATADDGATCQGSANFDVVAGQTTAVWVALQCTEIDNNGGADVTAEVNICPEITRMTVAPLTTEVGNQIAVSATATDNDGDTLTFAWSSNNGSFADSGAMNTSYACTLVGVDTITVTVDDGQGCTDAKSYDVNCLAAGVCGNGTLEVGEGCDDGNLIPGDGCNEICREEICGNGILDAGEECDDGNLEAGDECDAQCRLEGCGNGIVNPGEQCDDGNNVPCDGCDGQCRIETCGNGRQECEEACDDGNMIPGDGCEPDCTLSPTCADCENEKCVNYGGENLVAACDDEDNNGLCRAFVQCAQANDCAFEHPNKCFCGTVSEMMCMVPGNANGPCIPETQAAAGGIDNPEQIATRFLDPMYPIGDAVALLLCNKERCNPICL